MEDIIQKQKPQQETAKLENRKKLGRKTKFPDQNPAEKKRRVNHNEGYFTKEGKYKQPKIFTPVIVCCKKECFEKVDAEEQKRQFDKFYSLGSYEARSLFFLMNIRTEKSKYKSKKLGNLEKSQVRVFSLNNIKVCSIFFEKVLQTNHSRYDLALEKAQNYEVKDLRGNFKRKESLQGSSVSTKKQNHINSKKSLVKSEPPEQQAVLFGTAEK